MDPGCGGPPLHHLRGDNRSLVRRLWWDACDGPLQPLWRWRPPLPWLHLRGQGASGGETFHARGRSRGHRGLRWQEWLGALWSPAQDLTPGGPGGPGRWLCGVYGGPALGQDLQNSSTWLYLRAFGWPQDGGLLWGPGGSAVPRVAPPGWALVAAFGALLLCTWVHRLGTTAAGLGLLVHSPWMRFGASWRTLVPLAALWCTDRITPWSVWGNDSGSSLGVSEAHLKRRFHRPVGRLLALVMFSFFLSFGKCFAVTLLTDACATSSP